jgi:hypothetical protein
MHNKVSIIRIHCMLTCYDFLFFYFLFVFISADFWLAIRMAIG